MASFYRLAQRSLPSTAAAVTTASAVVAISFSDRVDDDNGNRNIADIMHQSIRSSLFRSYSSNNRPLYNALYSPAFTTYPLRRSGVAFCEAPPATSQQQQQYKPADPADPEGCTDPTIEVTSSDGKRVHVKKGMWGEEDDGLYHGLFPRRQLWRPTLEYPLWDYNWDGRKPPPITTPPTDASNGNEKNNSQQMTEAQRERYIRKKGVTRHIILIRHGQYDETFKEDEKRLLTPLGREQAALTGKRLGQLLRGVNEEFGPCRVKVVRVSNLARAKETADIIYDNMDLDTYNGHAVEKAEPEPLFNEGRPCHHIPGGKARPSVVERTDEQHPRIEQAFRKFFFRADMPPLPSGEEKEKNEGEDTAATNKIIATTSNESSTDDDGKQQQQQLEPHPQHEFEVIVCHANVIRYFFCRALQLPPEAWLRLCTFNCSLTYFTIRPTGTVSCRMLGDIGHLPHDMCTFSMHTGFNW